MLLVDFFGRLLDDLLDVSTLVPNKFQAVQRLPNLLAYRLPVLSQNSPLLIPVPLEDPHILDLLLLHFALDRE